MVRKGSTVRVRQRAWRRTPLRRGFLVSGDTRFARSHRSWVLRGSAWVRVGASVGALLTARRGCRARLADSEGDDTRSPMSSGRATPFDDLDATAVLTAGSWRCGDQRPRPRQRGAPSRGGGTCRAMHTNLVCVISSIPNRTSRRPVRRRAVRHVREADEISPAHAAGPAAGTVRRTVPRPITSTASPGAQAAMSWASSRRRRRRTASAGRPRIAGIASSNPR
jgi:hypothetical protein